MDRLKQEMLMERGGEMDLTQMEYYVQVYEDRAIAKAADHLYVSQQYISKVIRKIEEELGAVLFRRSRKGVVPTSEGDDVYQCFQRILSDYHILQKTLSSQSLSEIEGKLRAVADISLVTLLTPRPFINFSDKYNKVNMGLEEHRIFNCKRRVKEGEADIGFSICDGWTDDFAHKKILGLGMFILVHKTHRFAGRRLLTVADLYEEPLVFSGCPPYYTMLQEFEIAGHEPNIPLAVNELQSVMAFVKKNMGIAPQVVNPRLEMPIYPKDVVAVPYQTAESLNIYAYWNKEDDSAALSEFFADYMASYYR